MTAQAALYAARESRLLMQAVTVQEPVSFARRCCYCGAHCIGKACRCHTDLLALEQQSMRSAA